MSNSSLEILLIAITVRYNSLLQSARFAHSQAQIVIPSEYSPPFFNLLLNISLYFSYIYLAVQHERGPRKPKLRPADSETSVQNNTRSTPISLIQQRQVGAGNRSRFQQQHRQPFANKTLGEQIRSSFNSSSSATSSSINQITYSAASAFGPQVSSINQCNFHSLAGGKSMLNRNLRPNHSDNNINRGLSTPLISSLNCPILNSSTAFSSNRIPISPYNQASSMTTNEFPRSFQCNNNSNGGKFEFDFGATQNGRKLSSHLSSNTSNSEDETEEIIVDVEQVYVSQEVDNRLEKIDNISYLPSRRRSDCKQPPDKFLKYRLASGSQINTSSSPMNHEESFEMRINQSEKQQNDDNILATSYRSSHLFPTSECLSINPSFYTTQSLCDLPQTSVRASPSSRPNHLIPASCTNKRSHNTSQLEKRDFGNDDVNRGLLSNFKTTDLPLDGAPSSSSPSSMSDLSANQAFKDQQLRNSIFASFLSQLNGSIESQALIALLLKNNGLSDQKLQHQDQQHHNRRHHNHPQEQQQQHLQKHHQQQQIKQSSVNNTQRTYVDITKAVLSGFGPASKAMAMAAATGMVSNNGVMQLSGMKARADVGPSSSSSSSFNANEPSCLTSLGNSPSGSCQLVHHNDNHGLIIYNQSVNIPSMASTPSLDMNNKLEQHIDARKPPSWQFNHTGMMTAALPSTSSAVNLLSASSATTMSMIPRVSTMSRSKHVSSSLNTELSSPSPPSQPLTSRKSAVTPSSSSITSIDFKNIDSLITPNNSSQLENLPSTAGNLRKSINSTSSWQDTSSDTMLDT